MKRLAHLPLFLFALVAMCALPLLGQSPEKSAAQLSPPAPTQITEAYTLTGDTLAKAEHIAQIHHTVFYLSTSWGILSLVLVLAFGIPARFRDWSVARRKGLWGQGLIFTFLFLLLNALLDLPLSIYEQHVERVYGLSVQNWPSWYADLGKAFGFSFVITYLVLVFLMWRRRRSPRTWWFQAWCVTIPFVILVMWALPVVVEPMFNEFKPLQPAQPQLVDRLEQVVHNGGMDIPPSRMRLMLASKKTTELNAYVSGFGSTKGVVVWDNDLSKVSQDEILFIFGHEMGHYVLHHIVKEMSFILAGMFVLFYVCYRFHNWAVTKWGTAWGIHTQDDWAGFYVLALGMAIFGFLFSPYTSAVSRHYEHQADVYGMEVIHGIVANPQAAGSHSFQVLGETSLVDPHVNGFLQFWNGSHPDIPSRVKFTGTYDPWAPGHTPQFVKK